ncbi:HEPN domain-containing protein [Paradevosia shaoguanensis]|jgi:HEPN domain-containing protein|uniref:HEPN domain-containing protein n=1 Tax=Paradevosia shaoguanensis TaxID=1335043 RepID=UPI0019322402|nr:HEPN domain-containing protein [Paradevosia shaoguanensis]
MIPESSGATPFGIFLLADDFLQAARLVTSASGSPAQGPGRLLSYHAVELFLKAYLRSRGESIASLRGHGHDLESMLRQAEALGLVSSPKVRKFARKIGWHNDYVRARYLVTRAEGADAARRILGCAEEVREQVRRALSFDEFGNPTATHWLGPLPEDYAVREV